MIRTGPGPYRRVADRELRPIFNLTQQTRKVPFAFAFGLIPDRRTEVIPGLDAPAVTAFLRALLYVRVVSAAQRHELRKAIMEKFSTRHDIIVQRMLLKLTTRIAEQPWRFPVCMTTQECVQCWQALSQAAEVTGIPDERASDVLSGGILSAFFKKVRSYRFRRVVHDSAQRPV